LEVNYLIFCGCGVALAQLSIQNSTPKNLIFNVKGATGRWRREIEGGDRGMRQRGLVRIEEQQRYLTV
jgi:hypothetical protein